MRETLPAPFVGPLLTIAFLAMLVLAACDIVSSGDDDRNTAPDFQFTLYQGEEALGATELSLSGLRGKPLVLNFWGGLCAFCRLEMPDFQEFYTEYGDRVTLFGLDVGPFTRFGSRQDGRNLLEELDITYPAGSTTDAKAVRKYKILGMPTTFFITADGKIFDKWTGPLNRDKLHELTVKMLAFNGPELGKAGEGPEEPS